MQNSFTVPCPWQKKQWQHLLARFKNNNLPHALLLSGAKGLGLFEFAMAFAKQVLCEQGKQLEAACGTCRSCLLIQAHTHSDFYLIQPEEEGKQIRIDAIREIIEQLSRTAWHSGYKVVILQPAESLNVAASNAILKNLEEPAANTLFLLACNELSQLSATLRSRCQRVVFSPPNQAIALEWLQPQLKPGQNTELLLLLSGGAPLQALALAYEGPLQQRELLFTHLQQISVHKAAPSQIAAQWLKQEAKAILNHFINIVVDGVRINLGLPDVALFNRDKIVFIKQLANTVSTLKLFAYLDELYQLRKQLTLSIPLNQQLLLEKLFFKWYDYARCTT